jgi:hypothetical protein
MDGSGWPGWSDGGFKIALIPLCLSSLLRAFYGIHLVFWNAAPFFADSPWFRID